MKSSREGFRMKRLQVIHKMRILVGLMSVLTLLGSQATLAEFKKITCYSAWKPGETLIGLLPNGASRKEELIFNTADFASGTGSGQLTQTYRNYYRYSDEYRAANPTNKYAFEITDDNETQTRDYVVTPTHLTVVGRGYSPSIVINRETLMWENGGSERISADEPCSIEDVEANPRNAF